MSLGRFVLLVNSHLGWHRVCRWECLMLEIPELLCTMHQYEAIWICQLHKLLNIWSRFFQLSKSHLREQSLQGQRTRSNWSYKLLGRWLWTRRCIQYNTTIKNSSESLLGPMQWKEQHAQATMLEHRVFLKWPVYEILSLGCRMGYLKSLLQTQVRLSLPVLQWWRQWLS